MPETHMNVQHKIFASVGIVLLAATAAFAQQVKTGQDRATYLEPTVSPDGIEYVLVNGQVVIDHGKHTGARPGKIMYGPGRKPN